MMDSCLLLSLTVLLMFAGGHCYSESMSCSTVNGRTVCERQSGSGNTAGAFSGAFSGQHGSYQDAAAMTGNTQTGQSQSSRTQEGDGHALRSPGVPNFYPNNNAGWIGTGASDATSFHSDTGHTGISTSGFTGTSNNNGIPGPAFGGFAVADPSGNNFYGGGNLFGGGYAHGGGYAPAGGYVPGGGSAYGGGYAPAGGYTHGGGYAPAGGYAHGGGYAPAGGYAHGGSYGPAGVMPNPFQAVNNMIPPGFPFNIFGRKR